MTKPNDLDAVRRLLAALSSERFTLGRLAEVTQTAEELIAEIERLRARLAAGYAQSGEVNFLASHAYGLGQHPLDYAETSVRIYLNLRDEIRQARAIDPASFPGYLLETDDASWSRRILGELMDAGWTPPEITAEGAEVS
jgi:hypothetical protein